MDFKFAVGRVYHVLAETCLSKGDSQQALTYLEKLACLALEIGYKPFEEEAKRRIEEIKGEGICL